MTMFAASDWQEVISRVHRALMRRGRSAEDAEDLVQDAWLRLASYSGERAVERPEAFLMRTALNLSIDAHRMSQSRGDEVLLDDVVLLDAAPTVEDQLLARERLERLGVGVARLTEKTRTILLAHRVEGKTYQAIALERGLAVSTIEQHVAKGTMQLTAWMEGW